MKSLAVALIALSLLACSSPGPPDPIVDGWPIGAKTVCLREFRCDELLNEAIAGLARRDPGHADIVAFALHDEGSLRDADGNTILITRSGQCCRVVRFELADGSVRAIGVGFPGVSDIPRAVDYGP